MLYCVDGECYRRFAAARWPQTAGPEVREGRFRSGKCGAVPKFLGPDSLRHVSASSVSGSGYPRAMTRVALIGGGKMGSALVGGLLEGGWDPDELAVAEVDAERRRELEREFPKVRIVPSPAWAVADADVVIVAVKPADIDASLRAAELSLNPATLVVSIAAGVTLRTLEALVPGRPVIRAMPNTPALVGLGASAIAAGRHADQHHLDLASRLLGAVGIVVIVGEGALDAVTGLSGSGPAYIFLVAEAMIEAGVLVGLARDVSEQLVVQTLLGSATLLAQSDDGPESLRAAVTSPGGTTAAGLRELESARLRAAILDAVSAATRRSRELGAPG